MRSTNTIVKIGALFFPTVADCTYVSFARHTDKANRTEDIFTSVSWDKEVPAIRDATRALQLPLSVTRKGVYSFWPRRIQQLRLRGPDGRSSGPGARWTIFMTKRNERLDIIGALHDGRWGKECR